MAGFWAVGKNPSSRNDCEFGDRLIGSRALRGGAWNNNQRNARVADRNNNNPDNANNNIGFRLVAHISGCSHRQCHGSLRC
ncbi:MAG: SUMF1/EgtB/PvdO family nonheme iron enzyme [Anaerolineaceae bacterium]|nr:SUMF1/EgtB/PvdO family nonheme iron enzyme [Anaerolineaceae bacterium]